MDSNFQTLPLVCDVAGWCLVAVLLLTTVNCVMAALYGHLGPFEDKDELFADYAGRCDAFVAANDIQADRRANFFLATIGPATYKLLKNLCEPDNPNTRTYLQLKNLLTNHFEPAPIVIAERYKFWAASQSETESVADFVVRLKKLASTCAFGAFLNEALRDRLVSGLHKKMSRTQRTLLTMRDLNFNDARTRCVGDEMAGIANKQHMGEVEVEEAHKLHMGRTKYPQRKLADKPVNIDKPSVGKNCFRCGAKHKPDDCKYKEATCHGCGKKGHIRPACLTSKYSKTVNSVDQVPDSDSESEYAEGFGLYQTRDGVCKPYKVKVYVDNIPIIMELDTGASRSTVGERVYRDSLSKYELRDTALTLNSYAGTKVPLLGSISIPVKYGNNPVIETELIVVQGDRPALFGRDWLSQIKIDWHNMFSLSASNEHEIHATEGNLPTNFQKLLEQKKNLFSSQDTGIKHFKASLKLKPGAKPCFQRDRPVPYSLLNTVETEYKRLINADVLYPVTSSAWASPVVVVPKAQGGVRICGDYKGVNEMIENDGYKLPNLQDMFVKIAQNGQPRVYSVLDLQGAFNQLYLDEESAQLLVLNTHKGLMGAKRLCFGVKTAPAQFQATIDKILAGIPHVYCYIDDILIATDSVNDHLKVMSQIFQRLEDFNVRLNKSKCMFFRNQVQYLGHLLCPEGIKPLQNKLDAILKAPRPTDVTELKSFLGLVNFYGKFLPNLSTVLNPLYALLHHTAKWKWSTQCDEAFKLVKQMLVGDKVLIHYDSRKPLVLSVDASPYGLGAVLSHRLPDGSERPIAYSSRTLDKHEKNYAQIEKEALAIIFGVRKFHLYLYAHRFTLVTDHQPLTRIFGPKFGIPPLAAARMQRWALILTGYEYDIVYRTSADNANADLLSRLPVREKQVIDPEENFVFSTVVDELPIDAKRIAECTRKDSLLTRVYEYTISGWMAHCEDESLQPYWNVRNELSVDDGCLLWGRRVIIPAVLQDRMLAELHEGHPGMTRMKALARSFVWWPGLDLDIEDVVRACNACVNSQATPKTVPLLLWPWATAPWQRVHIDFAEESRQRFLIIVDSYSKWLEVFHMTSTTAADTIEVLRTCFARYGLPLEIVSDNGPQFVAQEFKDFLRNNGVKQTLCPPYHPASNGLAEKHVQTFKRMLKKCVPSQSLPHKIADVLKLDM